MNTVVQRLIYLLLLASLSLSGCSTTPAKGRLFAFSAATESGPGLGSDWAMEGQNLHRDRTTTDELALPLEAAQEFVVGGDTELGSPVSVAMDLIFVEGNQELHALALDGEEQWNFSLPGSYISPTIVDDNVFVRAESGDIGYVMAIRADTGLRLWQYRFPRVGSDYDNVGGHVTSPVVVNNLVLVGADHYFRALNAQTGAEVWVFDLDEAITSSATVADDLIFFTDLNYLYAVDLNTGQERWRFRSGDFSLSFAPVVSEDLVITTNQDIVFALNRANGEVVWSRKLPAETVIAAGAADDKIYAKAANQLFALDRATGSELWSFQVTDFISLPAIAAGQIFVVSRSGGQARLHALDISNGQELWQVKNTRLSKAAPVVAGGQLYVRTVDGSVLVYHN